MSDIDLEPTLVAVAVDDYASGPVVDRDTAIWVIAVALNVAVPDLEPTETPGMWHLRVRDAEAAFALLEQHGDQTIDLEAGYTVHVPTWE